MYVLYLGTLIIIHNIINFYDSCQKEKFRFWLFCFGQFVQKKGLGCEIDEEANLGGEGPNPTMTI